MDGVVVADEDLLAATNVPLCDDGHDVAEPRVVKLREGGVGRERVAGLVRQGRSIPCQALQSLWNIQASVSRQPGERFNIQVNLWCLEP